MLNSIRLPAAPLITTLEPLSVLFIAPPPIAAVLFSKSSELPAFAVKVSVCPTPFVTAPPYCSLLLPVKMVDFPLSEMISSVPLLKIAE